MEFFWNTKGPCDPLELRARLVDWLESGQPYATVTALDLKRKCGILWDLTKMADGDGLGLVKIEHWRPRFDPHTRVLASWYRERHWLPELAMGTEQAIWDLVDRRLRELEPELP